MNIVRRKEVFALFLGDLAVFLHLALSDTLTLRFGEIPTRDNSSLTSCRSRFFLLFGLLVSFIAGLYEKHTLVAQGKASVILTRVQVANALISIAFFYFIPYFNILAEVILFMYLVISLVIMVAWRMAIAETLGSRRR
jgi:hypothetical protein